MEKVYRYSDFINRELSWLEFNKRVLDEGRDKENPLLERLKFIAITASNLDEFFMVRVAGLKVQYEAGVTKRDISGLNPREQLIKVKEVSKTLVRAQYTYYKEAVKELREGSFLEIKEYSKLSKEQKKYLVNYYNEVIFPILTPMGIDAGRPFPHLVSGTVNLIIKLKSETATHPLYSVVQLPKVVKRVIELPGGKIREFLLLEELIGAMGEKLFSGYKIEETGVFRITRDGDMIIDEDVADDLLLEIEKEVKNRRWGAPVRVECSDNLSQASKDFLREKLRLPVEDFYQVTGPVDLRFLWEFFDMEGFEEVKYQKNYPSITKKLQSKEIFNNLKKKNYLLAHPYESFKQVSGIIEAAAEDKKVLAIKQTLYRVSGDSPVIKALMKAAQNGKQVTVLVELKARFDEERNIKWAKELERAGCHVIYGLKGLKVHAKCLLIIRREDEGIVRYLHLGTGNYNNTTAKLYFDLSYITCDDELGMDISNLFNRLTGFSINNSWKKIIPAPEFLRKEFYRLIEREIENARSGKKAKITAKMNALVDKGIIEKIYDASRAGVKIELNVRGACCLRSGVEGLSENIRVTSLIGRYLEHARIYYFYGGGDEEVYLSSADWMGRNLNRRIELLFPVEDRESKKKIISLLDDIYKDNMKLRVQNSDGSYSRVKTGKTAFNVQEYFFRKIKGV